MRTLTVLLTLFIASCGSAKANCDSTTCDGCCDQMTDTCRAGSEATACGTGGKLCIACPGQQVCTANVCKTAPSTVPQCSATNCDGCCDSTGTCQSGKTTESCGRDGETCAPCATGKSCISNENVSGVCQ